MSIVTLSPPKHWEDWVGFALGVWLLLSPWVLDYGEMSVTQSAVLVGFLLIVVEFVELSAFRAWEEWVNVVLGAWLIVSPWLLGAAVLPAANLVIVGLLVVALALYEIWDEHRHSPHPA